MKKNISEGISFWGAGGKECNNSIIVIIWQIFWEGISFLGGVGNKCNNSIIVIIWQFFSEGIRFLGGQGVRNVTILFKCEP